MQDEMMYTVIFSGIVIVICFYISLILNEFMALSYDEFGEYFVF